MSDWRSLTQAELDAAYDQRQHAPNMAAVMQRLTEAGHQAQERLPQRQRLVYGSAEVEALDWYPCGRPLAPVLFFIHGGAWRSGLARDYAFFVEWVLARGVDVVVPDFSAVTEVGGKLSELYRQVAQALDWVVSHIGGARSVHVCGHSSGAHLAACLAVDTTLSGQASFTLCSGLYDMEPVSLSSRSSYVSFTPDLVDALSPLRQVQRIQAPVTLLCGDKESPEFMRQSLAFHEALQGAGKTSRLVWGEGLNHFEILETLGHPQGLLAQGLAHALLR